MAGGSIRYSAKFEKQITPTKVAHYHHFLQKKKGARISTQRRLPMFVLTQPHLSQTFRCRKRKVSKVRDKLQTRQHYKKKGSWFPSLVKTEFAPTSVARDVPTPSTPSTSAHSEGGEMSPPAKVAPPTAPHAAPEKTQTRGTGAQLQI